MDAWVAKADAEPRGRAPRSQKPTLSRQAALIASNCFSRGGEGERRLLTPPLARAARLAAGPFRALLLLRLVPASAGADEGGVAEPAASTDEDPPAASAGAEEETPAPSTETVEETRAASIEAAQAAAQAAADVVDLHCADVEAGETTEYAEALAEVTPVLKQVAHAYAASSETWPPSGGTA